MGKESEEWINHGNLAKNLFEQFCETGDGSPTPAGGSITPSASLTILSPALGGIEGAE
jgi:hypothetical protein